MSERNIRPVSYKQYDARWASRPYQVKGETATIKGSGCGPTCAAMVIASLRDKSVTPAETCAWSVEHGYKAKGHGTYYSYFRPQMAQYGIECRQLLGSGIYHQPGHPIHGQVREYLRQGKWVIALMGPGRWTTGGHFVLVWDWDDKVRINDPASAKTARANGDPDTFQNEVKNYWLVETGGSSEKKEEDDGMDAGQVRAIVQEELSLWEGRRDQEEAADWAREAWEAARAAGVLDGSRPLAGLTRQEAALVLSRLGLLERKEGEE